MSMSARPGKGLQAEADCVEAKRPTEKKSRNTSSLFVITRKNGNPGIQGLKRLPPVQARGGFWTPDCAGVTVTLWLNRSAVPGLRGHHVTLAVVNAHCTAPRRPPGDARDAHRRQGTADDSLCGGDEAVHAWDLETFAEFQANTIDDYRQ